MQTQHAPILESSFALAIELVELELATFGVSPISYMSTSFMATMIDLTKAMNAAKSNIHT